MRLTWRDGLATLLVAASAVLYARHALTSRHPQLRARPAAH
jgi:hypothetical protein